MTGAVEVPRAVNEPVRDYAPGSAERTSLSDRLAALAKERIEAPMVIGGQRVTGSTTFEVAAPHRHQHVLADVHAASPDDVTTAIDAALATAADWAATPFEDR